MTSISEILQIAEIHASRIQVAILHCQDFFPFHAEDIPSLVIEDLVWLDLLVNRFGKLQDILGSKILDYFLKQQAEYTQALSMIDKIHILERLEIIESVELWIAMREARNHVAHEYPNQPALMAKYLNQIFELAPKLLNLFSKFQERIQI